MRDILREELEYAVEFAENVYNSDARLTRVTK